MMSTPFHQIDREMFSLICAFLTLKEKHVSLTQLSQISARFLTPQCYRNDTLHIRIPSDSLIDQSGNQSIQRSATQLINPPSKLFEYFTEFYHPSVDQTINQILGLIKLFSYVRELECDLENFMADQNDHMNILEAIVAALQRPNLVSLTIIEKDASPDSPSMRILSALNDLTDNQSENIKLKRLSLQGGRYFSYIPPLNYQPNYDQMQWTGLAKLTALETFGLQYMSQNYDFPTAKEVQRIAASLPNSIKHIDLSTTWSTSGINAWIDMLQSPSFAPYLEVVAASGDYYLDIWEVPLTDPLASTIMTVTGRRRPIRRMECCIYDLMPLNQFESMEVLHVHFFSDLWRNAMSIIPAAMPLLSSFKGTIAPRSDDVDASLVGLLTFLSRRPIVELELRSIDLQGPETCWDPFNAEVMTLWAAMRQLKSLTIGRERSGMNARPSPPFVVQDDVMIGLLPNCWSAMIHFWCDLVVNNDQLLVLTKAMPNLKHLTLSEVDDDINITSLPMINKWCPHLESLHLEPSFNDVAPVTFEQLQLSLVHFQLMCPMFLHLTALTIPAPTDAALHLLFSRLQDAPLKSLVLSPLPTSTFTMYLYQALPHLQTIDAMLKTDYPSDDNRVSKRIALRHEKICIATDQLRVAVFARLKHALDPNDHMRWHAWNTSDHNSIESRSLRKRKRSST